MWFFPSKNSATRKTASCGGLTQLARGGLRQQLLQPPPDRRGLGHAPLEQARLVVEQARERGGRVGLALLAQAREVLDQRVARVELEHPLRLRARSARPDLLQDALHVRADPVLRVD